MNRVVIDTDSLSRVLDEKNREHNEYVPLYRSIIEQKQTIIIYGGTKYNGELKRANKFLKLFSEFRKTGMAKDIDDQSVDKEEKRIIKKADDSNFNDHHIVAIVIIGRCNIICSKDSNSHEHYKNGRYYPSHFTKPKIYNGLSSSDILTRN